MVNRNKELAVNTVILGIGQLIPKFLTLIILPILTTYLKEGEFGVYDLILSFASFLIPIITLQIQQAVFRYILTETEFKKKEEFVTTSFFYVLISSAVIMPIVFVILLCIGNDILSALLICVLFFSESLYNLLGQIVRGLGFNAKYSISVIIYSVANLLFTVLLVMVLQLGLNGVIISITAAYIVSDLFLVAVSGMLKYIRIKSFKKTALKTLLAFSAPIVPSSIALWIVNLSDRLIIITLMPNGEAMNGIYAVSNKIPTLYSTAYSIFNLAWTETASRVSDDGDPEEYYSELFRGLFNFLVGAMLLLIAFTPLLFHILVKGEFTSAISQVPILYVGAFFNSFVNFYSGIYIAMKRTKQVGVSSIVGAIINIAINILLISKIGLYAASISTAVSFMVIALYRAYDLNKVMKIKYDVKNIIIGMSFFFISGALLMFNIWWLSIISFIIAAIYNVVYNINFFKKLINMVKRKKQTNNWRQ